VTFSTPVDIRENDTNRQAFLCNIYVCLVSVDTLRIVFSEVNSWVLTMDGSNVCSLCMPY
jgi:hypothetical protein